MPVDVEPFDDRETDACEADDSETPEQRIRREVDELLQELRAVIPGAQVLFAFLLSVAYTERFERLPSADRTIYFAVFLAATVSLVLLLAPTAFHRIQFRQGDKETMLRLANREAIAAMVLMSVAIAGSVYLVGRLAVDLPVAVTSGVAVGACSVAVWWLVPLWRRLRRSEGPRAQG